MCKVIRDGVLAEWRLQEKCQEKEEFRALAVKQSDLLKGEEEFDLLIEYLTENGEVCLMCLILSDNNFNLVYL